MRLLLFVCIFFSPALIIAQKEDSTSTKYYEVEADRIAKEAVSKIVRYTGLTANFIVVADDNISTAIAYLKNTTRYIAYNPSFIKKLNFETETNWAAVSVLAHEIGHHLSGHTLLKNSSPGNELIADKFSGFILFQMGATLKEANTALSTIGHQIDTLKHPPKNVRLHAVTNGWNEAKSLKNTDAYSSVSNYKENSSIQFSYKCNFKGDDNVYFVDTQNRIIWYNNQGEPIVVGSKEPSNNSKYKWIYKYLDNNYGVDKKGKIWRATSYGSLLIVGEVESIN